MQNTFLLSSLSHVLEKEHDAFEKKELNLSPRQIYNDWYLICFHESYFELLMSDFIDNFAKEVIEWLASFENPIQTLYDFWLDADDALSLNWDDIKDFIESVYTEEKIRETNDVC